MSRSISTIIVIGLAFVVTVVHAATREDPFRPPGYQITEPARLDKKKPKTWFVNEILHSEGRRVAIVNNITVKQGDRINGAKVINITANQVTLKYKDRIINSRLNMVPVKRLRINKTGR